MIGGFFKSYGVLLVLVGFVVLQQMQLRDLRRDLANSLVDKQLLERVLTARERPTAERPLTINVPGAGGGTVPVTVFLDDRRGTPVPPGQPPLSPRIVVDAPSAFCKTKEECDRIYARAPQAISADAEIRVGTVATVCLVALQAGKCPEGKRADLPLAEPIKFRAQFVLSERGVFQGLNVEGSPLVITQVRTETAIDVPVQGPSLPYHLGLEAGFLGTQLFGGAVYQNRVGPGFYRMMVGYGWSPSGAGMTAGAFFTLPLR